MFQKLHDYPMKSIHAKLGKIMFHFHVYEKYMMNINIFPSKTINWYIENFLWYFMPKSTTEHKLIHICINRLLPIFLKQLTYYSSFRDLCPSPYFYHSWTKNKEHKLFITTLVDLVPHYYYSSPFSAEGT
jgi:hypothetical protein